MAEETRFLDPGPRPAFGADFHVISPLGRIGDGLVYSARDGLKQARLREYAPPGVTARAADGTLEPADPRFAEAWRDGAARFIELGRQLSRIVHPGVAPIWQAEAGPKGDAWWIGAPAGTPIAGALSGGPARAPEAVLRFAQELAAALAEVHARGLVHLDIGPDTVSVTGGHVQLADFTVDNRGFMPLLQSPDGLVRPGFSPIELYDGSRAEPLGPPADIYAASALVYTLITGRPPAPWQERFRDPSVSQLADRPDYAPALIAAVRQGLAIEPEDRPRDGTEWLAAISGTPITRAAPPASASLPVELVKEIAASAPRAMEGARVVSATPLPAAPVHPAPAGAPPPYLPPQRTGSSVLLPLLIAALVLLALGVGGLFAWQQGWFDGGDDPAANTARPKAPVTKQETRPAEPGAARIEVGGTVSGQLTRRDRRRESGQFEDRFTLAGRAGQRLEFRLGSTDFDPLLTVTGPGFNAFNDDDVENGTVDSRLLVTLPRDGTYTISVSSYAAGAVGNYVLEVAQPRIEASITTPALLSGRWRRSDDAQCADPALIQVEGTGFDYAYGDVEVKGQVLDGIGQTIRVRIEDGPDAGSEARFVMAEDGGSFTIDGETWLRC